MTELYLNGYIAVMDKTTKIKVVFDNTYFTKSSTYTHDISLPMQSCPQNQKIFGPINRKDVSKGQQTLKAILVVDNKVLLNGTAIVREVTDLKAQVQLVSGNSEMNFFLQAEKKYIDQLALGFPASGPIFASYPDQMLWAEDQKLNWADYDHCYKGYVYFPVFNETAEAIYNRYAASYINISGKRQESFTYYGATASNICPQPYLCTMIKWIIKAIGYYLSENQLESTVFRNLFICNATVISGWVDLLPHWTVNEFFTNVEKAFGLITIVDEGKKTVRLLFSYDYFDESNPVYLSEVVKEFSTKIESEESIDISNANIGYSLGTSDTMLYAKLDEAVMEHVKIKKYETYYDLLNGYQAMDEWNRARCLLEAEGKQYIEYDDGTAKYLKEVNQFRDLMHNPEKKEIDIELKIVPASMQVIKVEVYAPGSVFDKNLLWSGEIQAISVEGGSYDIGQFMEQSVQNMIADGVTEKYKPDKLQIAFSDGQYKKIYGPKGESFSFPAPFVDGKMTVGGAKNSYPAWSLRLCDDKRTQNMGSEIYDKVKRINTEAEETFRFVSQKTHNPRSVFIIDNKRYVAKNITVECTPAGLDQLQEAIVYELL